MDMRNTFGDFAYKFSRTHAPASWQGAKRTRRQFGDRLIKKCRRVVFARGTMLEKPIRRLVGAVAVLSWVLVGIHGANGQEGKTYFYIIDPGAYVLQKLDGFSRAETKSKSPSGHFIW
jgi:hypothetical protein